MKNLYQMWDNLEDQIYKKTRQINKFTQDEIQDLFNEIDLSDIKPLSKNKKEKLGRYILKCKQKGIYSPYILYKCSKVLSKTNIYQKDLLEIKLLLIYDNQYKEYNDINQNAFKEVLSDGYDNCLADIKEKQIISDMDILLLALLQEIQGGYVYNQYINAKIQYDAEQMYKQTLINYQQQQENNINNIEYQKIIRTQNNQYLSINKENNKRSGFIEIFGTTLFEKGYIQACEDYKIKKVKFYGIADKIQTKMCNSLDQQEFYIHDWNEFYRYDDSNKSIVKHKCYGLVQGLNLPPIDNHFHFCRSFIIAIQPNVNRELEKKYSIFDSKLEKEIKSNYNISKAKLNGIDKNVLVNILDNMKQVYNDFPQIKDKIKEIQSIEHPNGGMNIEPDVKDSKYIMQINKRFFKNEKIAQEQYDKTVKARFHPKNTRYKDVGIHELGHCVTFEIIKKLNKSNNAIVFDCNENITARKILRKSFNSLQVNDKISKEMLINNISKYAKESPAETIGEAFADYYANKGKASILSKEIIKTMKGMI